MGWGSSTGAWESGSPFHLPEEMDYRTHDQWLESPAVGDPNGAVAVPVQPKDELRTVDDNTGVALIDRTNRELQFLHRFLSWQLSLGLSGCSRNVAGSTKGLLFTQGMVMPRVPPIPDSLNASYDPRTDAVLLEFLKEARREADSIIPSRANPELRIALGALLDPATAQAAWATVDEILAFERDFLEKTIIASYAAGNTPLQIQNHITRTYRVGPVQARQIHSCCMAVLVEGAYMTDEYRRAVLDYTIGDDIRHAQAAGDIRGTLAARKLQATAHQIIQPKPQQSNGDGDGLMRSLLETTARLSKQEEERQALETTEPQE